MTVKDVLALLRATTTPDRDVDFEIAQIVLAGQGRGSAYWRPEDGPPARFLHADTYTASLDAALALVEHMLPGASLDLTWQPRVARAEARLSRTAAAQAPTPALAVVTALFEALNEG